MDYRFEDKIDVKLITLFIVDSYRMPVPEAFIVDTVMLQPVINYFDLADRLAELIDEGFVTYYTDGTDRVFSITEKGTEALEYFSRRIPKTVRERLLNTVRLKIKELKNALSVKADIKKVNDIEYSVSLGISEGMYELFGINISVGDERLAKKICGDFKSNPQAMYSELLSVLIKDGI